MSAAGMYKEASEDLEKDEFLGLLPVRLSDHDEMSPSIYTMNWAYIPGQPSGVTVITICLSLMETLSDAGTFSCLPLPGM